jgi:hypothetical protein
MKFHALKKTFFLYYLYTTNFIWEPKYRDWAGNLIFKYSLVKDSEVAVDRQSERYRYLQAKHKPNEKYETITAADLLQDNNGEFSLPKYFRSYYRDIIKRTEGILPENVQDCIICTNIGFDSEQKLKKSGIELILLEDHDQIFPSTRKERNPVPLLAGLAIHTTEQVSLRVNVI